MTMPANPTGIAISGHVHAGGALVSVRRARMPLDDWLLGASIAPTLVALMKVPIR
jgi:hypothetical protein